MDYATVFVRFGGDDLWAAIHTAVEGLPWVQANDARIEA